MEKINRTIIIALSVLGVLIAIVLYLLFFNTQTNNHKLEDIKKYDVAEVILDDCTDEYEEMAEKTVQTDAKNEKLKDDDKQKDEKEYILKDVEGKICVFEVLDNNNEILYEKTDISLDYLPKSDKDAIQKGLKVYGEEKLNELIESYE